MNIAGAPQIILDFRHVASFSKPDRPKLATRVEKSKEILDFSPTLVKIRWVMGEVSESYILGLVQTCKLTVQI